MTEQHECEWRIGYDDDRGVFAFCNNGKCPDTIGVTEINTFFREYETLKTENKRLKDLLELNSALMSDVY